MADITTIDGPAATELLREMILIRQIEQRALDASSASPPKILGSIHLCAGQEAVPVGALAGLRSDDQVVATYRGHGWAIASGLSPLEVFGEIAHRSVGVNGGRGGSAYMMAPDRRFIGENSIVGAGVPIACGVAMANARAADGRVVIVSIGDGAFNQGATHEGMAFAAARNLPLILICENNGWSELTQTAVTFKVERIAARADGYGIPGVTIDGTNPLTIRDAVRDAAARARAGDGPTVIECKVPRLWGHYNRDFEHYRPAADREAARQRDPILLFSTLLLDRGVLDQGSLEQLRHDVDAQLNEAEQITWASAEPDPATAHDHVYAPPLLPAGSAAASQLKTMTFMQAINEALREQLDTRPDVLVYGEDVGRAGGIFGASKGLQLKFGPERVFDTPIAESAILGSAVGAALCGLKPIVEIMWADFLLVALDQLVNQAANVRYITNGRCGAPIVVRTQQGATPGSCAQHSQSLEALLAHVPGLRVAVPSTPQDAYDLLRTAVAAADPCVVFEARSLYPTSDAVRIGGDVEPMGKARRHGHGADGVIVSWGTMVRHALAAASSLAEEGHDVAVLDLRWLAPLDLDALVAAARTASGRVVVAHEANRTGGFGAEVLSRLYEHLGSGLRAVRVAAPDTRMPAAPVLMRSLIPGPEAIVDAMRTLWSTPVADSYLFAQQ